MLTEVHWVKVEADTGNVPSVLLERPLPYGDDPKANLFNHSELARVGTYWTPDARPFLVDKPPDWSVTKSGVYVRVPVFPYLTGAASLAVIFGLGAQIGAEALCQFTAVVRSEPLKMTLVLGNDCLPVPGGFRCWVGFAFLV